jgi:hypothetical protein
LIIGTLPAGKITFPDRRPRGKAGGCNSRPASLPGIVEVDT